MRVKRWKKKGEDPSATWQVPDIPGLWVYREPEGWVVGYKFYHPNPLAMNITFRVGGSYFKTRREALQAVEASLILEKL